MMAGLYNVCVVCRAKLYHAEDQKESAALTSENDTQLRIAHRPQASSDTFKFDRVFNGVSTQVSSLNITLNNLLYSLSGGSVQICSRQGFKGTIFAYLNV